MIEVDHLSKRYGRTIAIDDVTFTVEQGEILGFLGPNGAGKTTTMRILAGYLPASAGTARIAGFDVHEDSMAVRQRIGYLPETPPLYPEMTVMGFLNFVACIKGVSAGERSQRVQTAMQRCGLSDCPNTLIRKLSKGYRQRVGIAQAIVHDPPAIILDEPTVGLDPRQIADVRSLIRQLAGDHTVILSTHILPEVSATCDRVAIIHQGRIVSTDRPDALMAKVTRGSCYDLEVEGEADRIQAVLATLAGVQQVILTSHANDRYQVQVLADSDGNALGREVAAAIVQAGLGLYELRHSQASLEDVFLQLTTADAATEVTPEPVPLEVMGTETVPEPGQDIDRMEEDPERSEEKTTANPVAETGDPE